ncbi:hypothetical protein SDC9_188161 [bioreactor metagenome]|uniref:Uncharacterized protein n=1 Tax=bioreactor metagenome TaxID=1076179 RepID=A0A645HZA9_9ZZZZ
MHRDIHRRQAHTADFFGFFIRQICQRDVVAEQVRKPLIVIFKIQRLAHAFGVLVDKTEDTFVFTTLMLVAEKSAELQSEGFVLALDKRKRIRFSGSRKDQLHLALGCIKSVIQRVADRMAVDAHEYIADAHAVVKAYAVFGHTRDYNAHRLPIL